MAKQEHLVLLSHVQVQVQEDRAVMAVLHLVDM
jgi:hypothetical protein